jgi:periplasmic copper chaperone A
MNRATVFAATVSILTFLSGEALAHVSLEGKTVQAGASFDATFRVGHGCAGSPTVKLNIRIPNGVVAVEPEAKKGWSVTSESGPLDRATVSSGQSFSDGVKMVTWSGRLSPHQAGTFTLKARLADDAVAGQRVIFPVYQRCEKGEERWIDPDDEDDHPAPFLTIVPKR